MIEEKINAPHLLGVSVAALAPTFLLCLSIAYGVSNIYQQLESTNNEIKGVKVTYHLYHAISDLQRIRGLKKMLAVNDSDMNNELKLLQVDVTEDLDDKNWPELRKHFLIDGQIKKIHNEVVKLFLDENNKNNDINVYSSLVENLQGIIRYITDESGLILDPEMETYYLMDVSINKIPEITEAISVVRGIGIRILNKKAITESEKDEYTESLIITEHLIKKLHRTDNNVELKELIDKQLVTYKTSVKSLLSNCKTFPCILEAKTTPLEFYYKVGDLLARFDSIFFAGASRLEKLLEIRADKYRLQIIFTLIVSIVAILTIFYTSLYYFRQQMDAYKRLELISVTDPLTSIYNRRALDAIFDREINRAKRDGKGFVFGLVDVDNFKIYNDTYGHQKGDEILKCVAESFSISLRRGSDFYFRYGGEEFCFFYTADSYAEAKISAERVRFGIEDLRIEFRKNHPYNVTTVSIGAVYLPEIANEDIDMLIGAADVELYKAKADGKNCCKITTPEMMKKTADLHNTQITILPVSNR